MIKLCALSKTYARSGTKAVDGLSLEVRDGEIFGFLGPNGAGKTTSLKMLTGVLKPDAGSVEIDGIDMAARPLEAKSRFGYVGDDPELFAKLKAHEFLNFVADAYRVPDGLRRERIAALAGRFAIADALGSSIGSFSRGMKQKLCLTASLLHDPAAWILDEPMVGLDPQAAFDLKEIMRSRAAAGKCVLFSTHVMEVAEKICDRIAVINKGRVLFVGTLSELRAAAGGTPGQAGGESLESLFLELVEDSNGEEGAILGRREMTAPFPSLVRLYVFSLYGISRAFSARAAEGARKRGAKAVLKTIGIAALALLVMGDIGVLSVAMNLSAYAALKAAGLQGLLILNAATTTSLIVFMMGFITALSTYSMSRAENYLLALPIPPRSLLGAKMIMVYLSEFALAFFLMAIAVVIYGIKESPSPVFYLYGLLAAIATPLLPLALCYALLVPLMSAGRLLKNKNAVMVLGGLIGMAFAVLFNVYIQTATARMSDSAWILANFAGPDALIARMGSAYPPAYLAWASMAGSVGGGGRALAGAALALGNLALGLGAAVAAAFLLGPAYARSILGFDEMSLRRLSNESAFIARTFWRRPPLLSLFLREFRLMNREPIYFLNGPMVPLLMPLIFVIMYFAQRDALSGLVSQLGAFREGPGAFLAAAALGGFLGVSTSITCTALSRDAKALPYLKALPLRYRDYMAAKFLHGFAFSIYGAVVGAVGVGVALSMPALDILGSFVIALAFSALIDIAGLWLDTANPRLSWDSPTAAMKQNLNAVFVILGVMALIGALGALSAVLPFGKLGFLAAYGGGCAVLAALALAAFPRYAERRIAELE